MPELTEPIERINTQLERQFGYFEGRPRFRVVWADDQREKRQSNRTEEGFYLDSPRVVELKKYSQIKERYILEQLSVVPPTDTELIEPLSYECIWIFQDRFDQYLPPKYEVAHIVVLQVYENILGAGKSKKYQDREALLSERERLDKVEKELFGSETPVSDALAYGWGVVNPGINNPEPAKPNVEIPASVLGSKKEN